MPQSLLKETGASQEEIDAALNLRPLHWANNGSKSNDYQKEVTAKVNNNVQNQD